MELIFVLVFGEFASQISVICDGEAMGFVAGALKEF